MRHAPDGRHPRPAPRREDTLYLRVPEIDWTRVKIGEKTAFRTIEDALSRPVDPPTPVVAYTGTNLYNHDYALMVLEAHRIEPVFLASESVEALEREGYPDHDHFRRYWRARHEGMYFPAEMVHVWELRPWQDSDFEDMGRVVLERLYGEFYVSVKLRQLQG